MRSRPSSAADEAVSRRLLQDRRRAGRNDRQLVARERSRAPDMFQQELEAAVRLLETTPLIGSSYPAAPVPEVRRLMIGR